MVNTDAPISLAPPVTSDAPIQLQADTAQPEYMLTPDSVSSRAFKTAYALKGTPAEVPYPQAESDIQTGNEQSLRQNASDQLNADLGDKRYRLMTQALAAKNGPLSSDELHALDIAAGYNFPYTYPVNPNSVIEQAYGNQYVSDLDKFATKLDDNHPWNVMNVTAPTEMDAIRKFGSVTVAQTQYLLSKAQELEAKVNNQSWLGWGADFLKTNFPLLNPYYELKMRGNVPGTGMLDGGLLGSNLDAQQKKLFSMPFDKFTSTLDEITNRLGGDNPQLALGFISAMIGQSTSDRILNNINTIGHAVDIPIIFKAGGIAFNRMAVTRQVQAAAKDAIQAHMNPEDTAANVSAAVGDIGQAANIKASENITADLKGSSDPVARAVDDLPSHMKSLIQDIHASDLSTTRKNILEEQTKNTFDRFMQSVQDTPTPVTLPIDSLSPEQLAEISKSVPRRYGIQNDLINISDPAYNPFSKNYDVTMMLGKDAGVYFDSEQEAVSNARLRGFKVTASPEHIANLEARVQDLKDSLNTPLNMEDDVHALNLRDAQEKQLESLQKDLSYYKSSKGGFLVKNNGLGYYVELTASLNHDDKIIRDLLVNPERPESVSPDSWTTAIPYLNHLRTSEDTVSVEQRANRKLAVYPQSVMFKMAMEDGKYISDLMRGVKRVDDVTGEPIPAYRRYIPGVSGLINKKYWNRFNEVLEYSQNAHNPLNPDSKEGYYMTPQELDNHYISKYDERPTFPEVQAYEAVKRWSEMDLMFRKISEHRNMSRLGAETHEIVTKDIGGNEVRSPKFEGIRQNNFPNSRATILVMGDTPESSKLISNEKISQSQRAKWDEEIKGGKYQVVKVYRPRQFPFNGFVKDGDSFISYVIAPRVESSPLTWDLIPRQGGGHVVYDYPLYIKQPDVLRETIGGVRKANYLGDKTLIPVSHTPMGKDLVEKLNVVKNFIRDNKAAAAKEAYTNFSLEGAFGSWKEFKAGFSKIKNPDGSFSRPRFNVHEDFELVPKNKSTVEVSKTLSSKYGEKGQGFWRNSWRDATKEGSPADAFQVEFTGQRDAEGLNSVENIGSQRNPIYRRVPAKKVDPTTILNRGMRRIIHSSFMDDYKMNAVRSWIEEAKNHINEHNSYIERSPFYYFKNATRNMFLPGTPQSTINKLMANHFKINQLVGAPTVLDSFVYSTYQKIADTAYEHLGPKAASYITPTWLIPKLRDPFAFFRSVTFNAYLGLFAAPQILVQMMSYVNMFAISPRHATVGTMAAYLHILSRLNRSPEILEAMDRIASKMRLPGMPKYNPGEWKEALDLFDKSGFGNIGEEYAMLGDMTRSHLIQRGSDRFLAMGRTPFALGEKSTRIGAWYISMKEFRTKNPTGAITKQDMAQILDRADFLYGNMSNASHSMLNSGIFSLPFQFYNYTTRLAEMFWSGTRLGSSGTERNLARARLIFTNALMFGAPLGLGVTGLPFGDWLRKKALDEGIPGFGGPYVVGKNDIETGLMEGLGAVALHQFTGKYYDVGPRYGLQGLDRLNDIMWKDASFWSVFGGASASLVGNWFKDQSDLFKALGRIASGDYQSFPLKLEDLVNVFKEAYVVNKGQAAWIAMNTGRWVDKNYNLVEKTSWQNAAFMFLTGLTSTDQRDLWNKGLAIEDRQGVWKTALHQFQENMNRSIIAQSNGDTEQAQDYQRRAMAWLVGSDFPPEKLGAAISSVIKNIGMDKINLTNFRFYFQDAPLSQKKSLGKAFEWIEKNKGQ